MKARQRVEPAALRATVYVVDSDRGVREGLRSLLCTLDLDVETFCSAEEFLSRVDRSPPACLITEVHLPGMSGIELQQRLRELDVDIPVILLANYANIPMAVLAMHLGAFDFIEKPFVDPVLVSSIREAVKQVRSNAHHHAQGMPTA